MKKHEWRKKEKDIYIAKKNPELVTIPTMKYFIVSGEGNPNQKAFQTAVQALYTLSYTIRMMPKSGFVPEGYFEYTVYPLQGEWSSSEDYKIIKEQGVNKNLLIYDVMIRQPDFVDEALFEEALERAAKKLSHEQLKSIRFETIDSHKVVQMLHEGSFALEAETFSKMDAFIDEQALDREQSAYHTEIYLRMDKEDDSRNQTTLRYRVK